MRKIFSLICQEPYRIFFPLGILAGTIGASHWLLYSHGWIPRYSGLFHSSVQMKSYMFCFIIGFLLTSMPRFSGAPHATAWEFGSFLFIVLANLYFLIMENWVASEFCFTALLILLARFAMVRFMRKGNHLKPPTEFVWIPMAVLHGLAGSVLVLLSQFEIGPSWLGKTGKTMSEQGFLIAIVVGVGGFLAPRLMGTFTLIKSSQVQKKRIYLHLFAGFVLFASFWFEGLNWMRTAYFLRALVVSVELFLSRALPKPPLVSAFFAWILWISMWMVFTGSWAVVFLMSQRTAILHVIFIGGYALMTFAIGTMVTLSHGGETPRLQKPLWILWIVMIGMFFAVIFRIVSSYFPARFFDLLGIAASFWLAAGLSWFAFVLPKMAKIPREGEFERAHEEAKQQVESLRCGKPLQ